MSTMPMLRLRSVRMTQKSDMGLMGDFVAAYIRVFAGPPYFEKYEFEEVLTEVLAPHLRDGLVFAVQDPRKDGRLVGFSCAMPFDKCPDDVKEFLERLHQDGVAPQNFNHHQAWYMSELGVIKEYRGQGIAYELVLQRVQAMEDLGVSQYFMRTAAQGSNSKHLYLKIGAQELDALQDVSGIDQATENQTQSLQRVYLWGDCHQAVENIEQIKAEPGHIRARFT